MKEKEEILDSYEGIIKKHTEKLNIMKSNRAKWEEEKWTDSEIQECDRMIEVLASILSDLNKIKSPSSPLLCIEAKVIDEMIGDLEAKIKLCDKNDYERLNKYDDQMDIIKELKSKMSPIDPVKIKEGAWNEAEKITKTSLCYDMSETPCFNDELIQQDKNNYLS